MKSPFSIILQSTITQRLLVISLLLLSNLVSAELYVHQLQYTKAERVIPAIRPHLDPKTVISAKDFQLVIESTPEQYEKIKLMLESLDKQPGEFLIELRILDRRLADNELNSDNVATSQKSISTNRKSYQNHSKTSGEKRFSLRLIEGYQGFINTGQSFPIKQTVSQYGAFIPKTTHQKTSSGLYLTLNELPNNKVRLAVTAQSQNRAKKYRSTTQRSETQSYVSGSIGQWLLVASTGDVTRTETSKTYSSGNHRKNTQWYYIKANKVIN